MPLMLLKLISDFSSYSFINTYGNAKQFLIFYLFRKKRKHTLVWSEASKLKINVTYKLENNTYMNVLSIFMQHQHEKLLLWQQVGNEKRPWRTAHEMMRWATWFQSIKSG